jgi:hypothetical protein
MKFPKFQWLFVALCVVSFFPNPLIAQENSQWKVSLRSIGPIKIGMTVRQAEKRAGLRLKPVDTYPSPSCFYVASKQIPAGVNFMVVNKQIRRVDMTEATVSTLSGARVGDTKQKILKLYGKKIVVEPHKYDEQGHYLIYMPKDKWDKKYRLIFETHKKRVTQFRIGLLPEVEWVEGCL